jgi:hypothetical protein
MYFFDFFHEHICNKTGLDFFFNEAKIIQELSHQMQILELLNRKSSGFGSASIKNSGYVS